VRGYLGGLPEEWEIEVWGVTTRGAGTAGEVQTIALPHRDVRFRPLVYAGAAATRRVPLAVRYCAALATRAWQTDLVRDFDVLIAHRAEYIAALSLLCPTVRLPPSIAMIHGSAAFSYQGLGLARGGAYALSERVAVQRADAVALVSGSALPYYQRRYPRHADRILWIPNGVDITRFSRRAADSWRADHGLSPADRVLVYHGRYDHEKGIARMLDAVRLLLADGARWHLACAGVGPLDTLLAQAAAGWGKGRIHDFGYLSPEQVVSLLQASDLGLLCSDFEGLSNGLLEALAAGLPVVATNVGDNPLVLEQLASRLITDLAPDSIASAIRWAWEHRAELAERTPQLAERYSLATRVTRLRALLEDVAAKRPPTVIDP
jgi:glycosyltransferase involved in cell wall biosynthesis